MQAFINGPLVTYDTMTADNGLGPFVSHCGWDEGRERIPTLRRTDIRWSFMARYEHVPTPFDGNPPFVPLTVSGSAAAEPVIAADDTGDEFDENAGDDDFADIDAYDAAHDEESQIGERGDVPVPMEGVVEGGEGRGAAVVERGAPSSVAPLGGMRPMLHSVPVSVYLFVSLICGLFYWLWMRGRLYVCFDVRLGVSLVFAG